uniref:Bifunctional dihydrofolate reductase-thymidylate synthase n=1 Tax=Aureoumbra lagunensis TaxID=44058 RepID=A0A7S3NDE8_9STRA|mmetsp:Transcript_17478/g.22776  ORF Transcript_17478/g.22776 Transcript_17478/m.22776 type:complete len:486 (+) Transcript_17478:49-1506(+)
MGTGGLHHVVGKEKDKFNVIVAATSTLLAIGRNGKLPWRLPGDLAYFKRITIGDGGNGVIMGRKTWESIPTKFRPLSDRKNVVLSRTCVSDTTEQCCWCSNLEAALQAVSECNEVFIIGGAEIYKEALADPRCATVYMTSILSELSEECDAFFPQLKSSEFRLTSRSQIYDENDISYRFEIYQRIPHELTLGIFENKEHEEMQYLQLIQQILDSGAKRDDRTGTGTLSIFGTQMRFCLRNEQFPLLTTKRVFWRGVAEELLWFIKGCTNANELSKKKVHIWDDNGSREFLDAKGLQHRQVGDLGPVYGFQWRHFGAEYKDFHTDYSDQGVDQLRQCIELIKSNPYSRRIILSAWNPTDLQKMALPPCHMMCQFYVANNELSCHMYQRSADMGLGVPFNIASYALLTRMLAQVCGLKPGDFVHTIGDAHVYCNHIDALTIQLKRQPKPFPKLSINPDITDIDQFSFEDFTIHDYNPHPKIPMKMAI